jgi:hypothetical protein
MKKWRYEEPDWDEEGNLQSLEPVVITMSEHDILLEYYPFWCEEMRKAGKANEISEQSCIEDWIVTNWAYEVKDEEA